jgi:hypothetical protein
MANFRFGGRSASFTAARLKGMSSEKHFFLPERQKYFSGIQPPATLPTVLL